MSNFEDSNSESTSFSEEAKSHTKENIMRKPHKKFELNLKLQEKLVDFPEVLEFIETLKKYIEKQRRKIHKLKARRKRKDIGTQTDVEVNLSAPKTLTEEIVEAAELATQNSGFVFEETSGMYYDYNSGYYYNAEYGLYYDGNSGTYMTYNQETKTYDFYSQVELEQKPTKETVITLESKPKIRKKRKKKCPESEQATKRTRQDTSAPDSLEDGECSDSSQENRSQNLSNSDEDSNSIEAANAWPPCMRVIVEKSSFPNVKQGSLYVITYKGGSLGREGDHSILIPDINVSKHHLKFSFDEEKGHFLVTDLGSRNGTLLNGKRMSTSKQESEPLEITHGAHIQIGTTVLLCHVHEGHQTCSHCEPGLLLLADDKPEVSLANRNVQHKKELQNLRKKFGVAHSDGNSGSLAPGYTDRARNRRQTVGSQNHNEKTQVASVNESIPSENKGFKMLAKMGWTEGQSLGKDGLGLVEPIVPVANQGTSGMGSGGSLEVLQSSVKQELWRKTQERFKNLPDKNDSDNSD